MFICGMVLRCAGTFKNWFDSGSVTVERTTSIVHDYKLLMNDIKPVDSIPLPILFVYVY